MDNEGSPLKIEAKERKDTISASYPKETVKGGKVPQSTSKSEPRKSSVSAFASIMVSADRGAMGSQKSLGGNPGAVEHGEGAS